MEDSELIKRFIRIEGGKSGVKISVCQIHWKGPYTPLSHWKKAKTLSPKASIEEVEQATQKILHNPRYFQVCVDCNERNPVGWMTGNWCHSCSEQNHDIVY